MAEGREKLRHQYVGQLTRLRMHQRGDLLVTREDNRLLAALSSLLVDDNAVLDNVITRMEPSKPEEEPCKPS